MCGNDSGKGVFKIPGRKGLGLFFKLHLVRTEGVIEKLLVRLQKLGSVVQILTAERAIGLHEFESTSNEFLCAFLVFDVPVDMLQDAFLCDLVNGFELPTGKRLRR